jgi:hypothetical protein
VAGDERDGRMGKYCFFLARPIDQSSAMIHLNEGIAKDVFGFVGPSSGLQIACAVAPNSLLRPLTHQHHHPFGRPALQFLSVLASHVQLMVSTCLVEARE